MLAFTCMPPLTKVSTVMPHCPIRGRPGRRSTSSMERYLGPTSRTGKGSQPDNKANREEEIYRAAGFYDPQRIEIPGTNRRAH